MPNENEERDPPAPETPAAPDKTPGTYLDEIDVEEPAKLMLKTRSGGEWLDDDGVQAFIELYPTDSDVYKQASRMIINRRMARDKGRRPGAPPDFEVLGLENAEIYALATKSWYLPMKRGVSNPYTKDAAKRVYHDFDFIREQVENFLADRANFTTRSSPT